MDPHSFIARAEAQRWIGIAEKLLMGHDLVGSKTFAIRARESDPRLEAADQILAVADTLLAAEKRVVGNSGSQQPDFYAILQLVRFVQDTDHIAAQYRRLAILLNPHQNRFPYSDQAFQLVNDAWAVLSNPMRKSMYDSDLDFPPQQQMNPIGFNLEQQHHHQHHHQQQQQHNFFSINHIGSGHEREMSEPPFQTRVQQQQQLQQHNFLSQSNPIRPAPAREQEQLFQQREQEQLFQPQQVQPFHITSSPQVQPFHITSTPQQQQQQQSRPPPQPPQPQPPMQPPTPPPPAAPPQSPLSWPQAPPLSQPLQPKPEPPQLQPQHQQHLQPQPKQQQSFQPQQQQQQPLQPHPKPQPQQPKPQPQQPKPQPQQPKPQPQQSQPKPQQSQPKPQQSQPKPQQQHHLQPPAQPQPQQPFQPQPKPQPELPPQPQPPLQPQPQPQQQQSVEQNADHVNGNNGVREEEVEVEIETETEAEEAFENVEVDDSPTFWTACPYCFYMYEYPRVYADCTLRCDNCKRAIQAVPIASPPPVIEGQEAYFCCWGFFPVGVSMSHLEKNNGTVKKSKWTPFSPFHDASSTLQNHLNDRAAPKMNTFVNKSSGPRIYIDDVVDDVFMGISEPSDDSDVEWGSSTGTKKKKAKRGPGDKNKAQTLATRTRHTRNAKAKNPQNDIPLQEGVEAPPTVPVTESSKKAVGSNPRRQSVRVKKELGKLDLNVEFNNNEGEEPAPGMTAGNRGHGQGEDDNIEGIGFFEGLDEFLSSLPILSVVNDEKVKAA